MSTFKTRIEDYVGAVGDDTFLGDALTDTASEIIRAMPIDKIKGFTQESGDITDNSTNIANHRIVSVMRERGTDNEYVECRELSVKYFRKAQDSTSMFSASVESPVYIIKNSSIYVFPTPGASPNAFRVESVVFPTVVASATDITDTPDSFPDSIEDIVVVGASAKACQYLMARVKDSMPSEPVLVLSDISVPSTPSDPTISYSNASTGDTVGVAQDVPSGNVAPTDAAGVDLAAAPTNAVSVASTGSVLSAYTRPTVTGSEDTPASNTLTLMTAGAAGNAANKIDFDTFWDVLADYIEDEEDAELAGLQITKIRTYIEAFNSEVASARNAMQALTEDARNVTQASIASKGDDVRASIANASNDVSIKASSISSVTSASIANASNDVNVAISKMNQSTGAAISKMRESTNVNVSNAAKTLEASIQDYNSEISKFGTEIQRYSAEVNSAINEYSNDIQKYSVQVDRYTKEYSWYQDQYVRLEAKFKESLQVLIAN
tara:strand:- start:919 stop:2400 length:1482 start_codon:yes stop_codon:yes gene_type:complete